MGSTSLRAGDTPSEALRAFRVRYGGRAQLLRLIELTVDRQNGTLAGIAFTLKHRAPRNLEAIEHTLLVVLADVENALAHVRLMILNRDKPVTMEEEAFHGTVPGSTGAELAAIVEAGADG